MKRMSNSEYWISNNEVKTIEKIRCSTFLYIVELSAPGFNKESFKLEVHKGVLSISGNHEEEKETREKNYSRKEYNRGSFVRKFNLPQSLKEDAIDARYENGFLKVSIPKQEEAKRAPKEIKIS
jgi:HSP20 family protein